MYCIVTVVLFVQSIQCTSSLKTLELQTGASVTIPCHYDAKYVLDKKYWCYHATASFNYCTIQAYTNTTQGKLTVTDEPAQSLFTVTMRDLQEGNTGTYWCAVEIGGIFQPDVTNQFYLNVNSAPAVSVLKSRVSGDEGGSVHVQCFYSAAYQNQQKQWCRSTDWSCYTLGRTDPSQNAAVQISDDGERSFMVEMTGLKKSDAGWYWCSVGDLQVPVHLSVTGWTRGLRILLAGFSMSVVTLLVALATWTWRRRYTTGKDQSEGREGNTGQEHNTTQMELLYTPVIFNGTETQSHLQPEDPVAYSTLMDVKQSLE